MKTDTHPVLTTNRLLLRPYQETDWAAAHAYGVIPEVSQFMEWGPNTEEDTRAFIERCVAAAQEPEARGFFFAIVLTSEGTMISGCDIGPTNRSHEFSIGYCLHPDYWGHGYTTEAAGCLLRLGFEGLGLRRITSECDPDNVGSWRVMEKIGMRREAQEREAVWFKDRWHDWLRYAILDHEWKRQAERTIMPPPVAPGYSPGHGSPCR